MGSSFIRRQGTNAISRSLGRKIRSFEESPCGPAKADAAVSWDALFLLCDEENGRGRSAGEVDIDTTSSNGTI